LIVSGNQSAGFKTPAALDWKETLNCRTHHHFTPAGACKEYKCIAKTRSGANRPQMTVVKKVFTPTATFTVNLSLSFQCTWAKCCESFYCREQLRELGLPDRMLSLCVYLLAFGTSQ